MHMMAPESISTAYFINPPTSNTNTAASQIVEVITLILLECLNEYTRIQYTKLEKRGSLPFPQFHFSEFY
jgi:hypothetical protein